MHFQIISVLVSVATAMASINTNFTAKEPGMRAGVLDSSSSCSTPSGSGTCMSTSECTGTSIPGYCAGPADIQCCVLEAPVSGDYGIDACVAISASTQSCFMSSGFSAFIIPRGYHSTGSVDTSVCTTIENGYSAGVKVRDTYMFPCPTCSKSASTQFGELVNYLQANCPSPSWSGRVWLDIEGSQYWLGSTSKNQAWYEQLVDACGTYGVACGVYSSSSQWSAIFGSTTYSYGSSGLPLWYAHYDNSPSFSDFSAFGGWKEPHAKQYMGDVTVCSTDVDKSFAVSF